MTNLQKENLVLKEKLKEGRKRWKAKADEHISRILSKWVLLVGGGCFTIGALAGKFAR